MRVAVRSMSRLWDSDRWSVEVYWGERDKNMAYEIVSRRDGDPQHMLLRRMAHAFHTIATVVEMSEFEASKHTPPEGL